MSAVDDFLNKKSVTAAKLRDAISSMLNSGDYDYAEDTLIGIFEDTEKHDRATDAQIQAVENIRDKPDTGERFYDR